MNRKHTRKSRFVKALLANDLPAVHRYLFPLATNGGDVPGTGSTVPHPVVVEAEQGQAAATPARHDSASAASLITNSLDRMDISDASISTRPLASSASTPIAIPRRSTVRQRERPSSSAGSSPSSIPRGSTSKSLPHQHQHHQGSKRRQVHLVHAVHHSSAMDDAVDPSEDDNDALMMACEHGHVEIVRLLRMSIIRCAYLIDMLK